MFLDFILVNFPLKALFVGLMGPVSEFSSKSGYQKHTKTKKLPIIIIFDILGFRLLLAGTANLTDTIFS